MKNKIISIILITLVTISVISITSFARSEEFIDLELKVVENNSEREPQIFMLLPEEYIKYAISNDELPIEYRGSETLSQESIPSININLASVMTETYNENGKEYVQIALNSNENKIYKFQILKNYVDLDMKYRIITDSDDFIVHIDNFKVKKEKCEIEYNVAKNQVKQPDTKIFSGFTVIFILLIVIVIIVGGYSYIKRKK